MDFSSIFRKVSAEDSPNSPCKNVKIFSVLNCESSKTGLDQESLDYLLESSLKSCTFVSTENSDGIQDTLNLKSHIKELDLKKLLSEECMIRNSLSCEQSSKSLKNDFKEFSQCFQKKTQQQNFPTKEISERRTFSRSVSDTDPREQQKNALTGFLSAREELHLQNINKYGSSNNSDSASNAPKKTLGMRPSRGLNKKFVSPLLSNRERDDNRNKENFPHTSSDDNLRVLDEKMVEIIKSEIIYNGAPVDWNDIAGLQFAKSAIQEAVIWPMLRPDIFTGLRRPPKGILLFGPPGTGKTLIGKCVASQSKSTFFSISASSLTSKFVGDGEKMVRTLFAVARAHQPAVIFIDEIDSLLSQRNDTEHESSRRIKTEFLVQLDGAATNTNEKLLLISATNRPQELDEAARRRFVKRLYIPLPQYEARLELLQKLIAGEKHALSQENFEEIAKLSEGYSGADIRSLCSEASLGPIRSINTNLIENISAEDVRPLMMEDFQKALMRIKASVSSEDLDQYVRWDKTFGCGF